MREKEHLSRSSLLMFDAVLSLSFSHVRREVEELTTPSLSLSLSLLAPSWQILLSYLASLFSHDDESRREREKEHQHQAT